MVKEDEIRMVAYNIWEEEGRPDGKDIEHYLRAKKILDEREENRIIELAPVSPAVELAQPPKKVDLPPVPRKLNIREQHKKK